MLSNGLVCLERLARLDSATEIATQTIRSRNFYRELGMVH